MTSVLLIAHGKLGVEMKNSVEMIFGEVPQFAAIAFTEQDGLDSLSEKILKQLDQGNDDTLIVTDLFCGTPYNASCSICLKDSTRQIEVISGMSLPVVLEIAAQLNTKSMTEIISLAKKTAGQAVKSFKEQIIVEEEDF